MKFYFVPPGEGLPLWRGKLITEHGDELEGYVITAAWDGTDGKSNAGMLNPVVVSLTVMTEAFVPAPQEEVEEAKQILRTLLEDDSNLETGSR